jgi:hypothetical protein
VDGNALIAIVNFFLLPEFPARPLKIGRILSRWLRARPGEVALHTILQRDDMALATVGKKTRNPSLYLKHRIQ